MQMLQTRDKQKSRFADREMLETVDVENIVGRRIACELLHKRRISKRHDRRDHEPHTRITKGTSRAQLPANRTGVAEPPQHRLNRESCWQ